MPPGVEERYSTVALRAAGGTTAAVRWFVDGGRRAGDDGRWCAEVKVTVNFDDPGTYHFYFGDEVGRPGSILTFFPWPEGRPGRQGTGQVGTVSLAVSASSLGYWIERLLAKGVRYEGPARRFDEQVLSFADPDGLLLEIVASPRLADAQPWREGPVPPEHAIGGVHGVTIWEQGDTGSADFLVEHLGMKVVGEEANRLRLESPPGAIGSVVDLRRAPGFWQGAGGVGTVHHVAFRAASDEEQLVRRTELERAGVRITPVIDRQYFNSVYFNEPGGVLLEIATDGPGFAIDETPEELGTGLQLPAVYQPMRERIERSLPPLRSPEIGAAHG